MRRIPDASAQSLVPFAEASVEPGSVVHIDGWLGGSVVRCGTLARTKRVRWNPSMGI
jgi:hypothetical protein